MTFTLAIAGTTDLTGLDFEADLDGRVYENGVKIATPGGVAITPLAGDPTRGVVTGLPLVAGRTYAASYLLNGSHLAAHWPAASYFSWRLLPIRTSPETVASLALRLIEGTAESAYPLALAEGVAGEGDWIASGWPQTPGPWALTWSAGGSESALTWSVAAAAAPVGADQDFWGRIVASTHQAARVAESVTFTNRAGAPVTMVDCRVVIRAVHGFSSGGALQTSKLRQIIIPRIAPNVRPEKSWTARLSTGEELSVGAVLEQAGHFVVESAER